MNYIVGQKVSFDISDGTMVGIVTSTYLDLESRRKMVRVLVPDFGEVLVDEAKCFKYKDRNVS